MSMRDEARSVAEGLYTEAVRGLFGLIERRIEWRRANAQLLALEAERMVQSLRNRAAYPRVAFRNVKIWIWQARYRKHAARAYAENRMLSIACGVCPPKGRA